MPRSNQMISHIGSGSRAVSIDRRCRLLSLDPPANALISAWK
jgi:hypothetical protein